jgi:hypothetical protein
VQFKRGTKVNIPVLDAGEPYFAYDMNEFYVGSSTGNVLVAAYNNEKTTVTDSTTNGYIIVDGNQLQVYDDSSLQNALNGKANKIDLASVAMSGNYNDLSNIPSIPTKTSDLTNDNGFTSNQGDMQKSTYDTDNSGIVDDSEKLGGQSPTYYAKATEIDINNYTTTPTFDANGILTQVEETDGTTVKKRTTTLTYNSDGTVNTITDVLEGKTVVSTLNYTNGEFTSVTKVLTDGGL